MTSVFESCVVAALVAASFAGDTAVAGGGNARRDLVRPPSAPVADAAGTVRLHRGRRVRMILALQGLAGRRTYQVRDRDSGALLGEVTTNRAGRARFDLTRGLAKAAQEGADDGTIDEVEVDDAVTSETVLTGDLTPEYRYGYETYNDTANDRVEVSMGSYRDPGEGDALSFKLHLPIDANDPNVPSGPGMSHYLLAHRAGFGASRGTTGGPPTLPLGVHRVTELVGRAYEIRAADGRVVAASHLPELEVGDLFPHDDGGPTEAEYAAMIDPRDDPNWHALPEAEPDAATAGYRVFIADAQGVLRYALNMTPEWVSWDPDDLALSYCDQPGCSIDPPAWFIKLIDRYEK